MEIQKKNLINSLRIVQDMLITMFGEETGKTQANKIAEALHFVSKAITTIDSISWPSTRH